MRVLFILLLISGVSLALESRSWIDIQGRKIEATLVTAKDQIVTLKLSNGKEVPFPLAKLSSNDQVYVAENQAQLTQPEILKKENATDKTQANFDSVWPERIKFSEDPEVNTIEENVEEKRFIYESANYRYVCDVRLSKSVVKGFAVMFEATQLYCSSIPLGINGGDKTQGKLPILLFENFDDYVKAGG
ncbi:MAG: hypothetical protein JHD00_11555, partial [Akkermansiaceae bacterium]|nr:hypothetical protein [Akkermansiaceae bacterium]